MRLVYKYIAVGFLQVYGHITIIILDIAIFMQSQIHDDAYACTDGNAVGQNKTELAQDTT